ncbi:hypothetical protein BY457_102171 [Marinilabilia salmonicolor]|nr:hypothetical protein BY457_102171 [Marinilabilia salmonicolor]
MTKDHLSFMTCKSVTKIVYITLTIVYQNKHGFTQI